MVHMPNAGEPSHWKKTSIPPHPAPPPAGVGILPPFPPSEGGTFPLPLPVICNPLGPQVETLSLSMGGMKLLCVLVGEATLTAGMTAGTDNG